MNRRSRIVGIVFLLCLQLGVTGGIAKAQGVIHWPWPLALIGFAPLLLFLAGTFVCAAVVFVLTASEFDPFDY